MVETWYALLTALLTLFVVLDGWNLGAGILHYRIAPSDAERRDVIRALGPAWGWSETWLVAFGGCLFLSFPKAYATIFAGFYLAFFLVLWLLIARGIAIEFGHVVDDRLWRALWDWLFRAASAGLALLIGIAAGNAVRGLPLDAEGRFALPFFTDFGVHGVVGLIDWFTLSAGVFTMLAMSAHGAAYVAARDDGVVGERSARLAPRLWIATVAGLGVMTVETSIVRPELLGAMAHRPLAWVVLAVIVGGALLAAGAYRRARAGRIWAFAGSCAALGGVVVDGAIAMFPTMLFSTGAGASRTAYQLSATTHNLAVALSWWSVAIVLALMQLAFIVRSRAPRPGAGPA